MSSATDTRAELHRLIETLDEREAVRLLAIVSLWQDDGELTEAEKAEIRAGEAQLAQGDSVSHAEFEQELGIRGA